MNFKDWKKIKEEGKMCTLQHPKGHTMTIYTYALPKIHREQLKRLPFAAGGEVKYNNPELAKKGLDSIKKKSERTPEQKKKTDEFFNDANRILRTPGPDMVKEYAKGGEVQNYDEGSTETVEPAAAQAPGAPTNMVLPDETLNAPGAVQQQQKAIQAQVPIDIAKSKAMAENEAENIRTQQSIQQANAAAFNDLKGHTDDFNAYIQNNPISPKAYQENQSTGSKVATAIGLFTGGAGVPFGGHNFAQDFLNQQIDRDIQGQKARAEQQKTVWGAYRDLYGDSNIATNLAKVSANDILVHKTNMAAAQQGTPQAKQAAMLMQSQKAIENQKLLFDAAKIKGALPGSNSGTQGSGASNMKGAAGTPGASLAPDDPNWGDINLSPGQGGVPKTNAPPQIGIDYNGIKKSQMLGAEGVPGHILPGEVGAYTDATNSAEQANQAIREIHKQYGEMWKNATDSTDATSWIAKQHILGSSAPDMRNWTEQSKRYYTAASAVQKQIANVMKGGGSDELYSLIKDQLVRPNDKSHDYRQKLENLDNVIRQQVPVGLLKKYPYAKGLPK